MSTNVISCDESESLDHVLSLMQRYQLRRIPVVDHNAKLQGIVSQADVATRVSAPEKTANLVHEFSQPAGGH
jgi:CBS-domain-containing membrane protein